MVWVFTRSRRAKHDTPAYDSYSTNPSNTTLVVDGDYQVGEHLMVHLAKRSSAVLVVLDVVVI